MAPTVRALLGAILLLLAAAPVSAQDWTGNWKTTYGQLRLVQDGDRLYGDYAERGVIEGRIGPDGRTVRGFFVRNDGGWGPVEWRREGERFAGTWAWGRQGIAALRGGTKWTGRRTARRPGRLRYAVGGRQGWPKDDAFAQEPFRSWILFRDRAPAPQAQAQPQAQGDPRSQLSELYGGYVLTNIEPAFSIGADVIHFRDANTASVDLSIYARPGGQCPPVMHTALCRELRDAADTRGFVRAQVTGVTLVNLNDIGETIRIGFRLAGDRTDRLMRLRREATYFSAAIFHPRRGYDYEGFAKGRSHVCEQSQCQNAVFTDLRDNPERYRLRLSSGKVARLINGPNDIARSHGGARPAPSPSPSPAPAPAPRALLDDAYAILDETSENLGTVRFSLQDGRLAASGSLENFFDRAGSSDTVFTQSALTDQAVAYDLTVYPPSGNGRAKQGRLLVELPSHATGNPRGTLIVGRDVMLVELVRPTRGLDPQDVGDTPAIGIYAVAYDLRDVPAGRTLRLRKEPQRDAAVVGSLPAAARGLQILKCARDINSERFRTASQASREAMLAATWCQITDSRLAGWVPGRYLRPVAN